MKKTKRVLKPVSLLMAMVMLMVAGPVQTAAAAMIGTRTAVDAQKIQDTRETLNRLLARQDVQAALIDPGIQPDEARQRVAGLTDGEVMQIAEQLDQLPAGAGFLELVGIVVVVGFLVFLITDMLGFTDIFPFINASGKR